MIFRPDIKPPMWGPPEAVAHAVRANAERIGINPTAIKLLMPGWLGGVDIVGMVTPNFVGSPTHDAGGYKITDGQGLNFPASPALEIANPAVIWHGTINGLISSSYYNTIVGKYHTAWSVPYYQYALRLRGAPNAYAVEFAFSKSSSIFGSIQLGSGYLLSGIGRMSLGAIKSESVYRAYRNTESAETTTSGSIYYSGATPLEIGEASIVSTSRPNHTTDLVCVLDNCPIAAYEQMLALPYALLMPVARPVYFDLVGGGTSLTTLQNLAAYLASTGQTAHNLSLGTATSGVTTTQDLAASLLTDATTRQDLVASIATGMTTAQDLENLVATGITTSHDLRLMLASEIETAQDLLLSVSELVGTVVSQDLLLSVATETTGTQDLATLIATSLTLNHALRTAVATTATTAHDLSLQVSELVGTIVRQDLSLTVSTDLAEAQNLAAAITSELATVQDIATRIATGQELTTELAATVATALSTAQDLALHASAIMEVISRQDLELSVASELATVQDLLARVLDATVTITEFIDYCRPRSFEDVARPRIFVDYCRPRGRA